MHVIKDELDNSEEKFDKTVRPRSPDPELDADPEVPGHFLNWGKKSEFYYERTTIKFFGFPSSSICCFRLLLNLN
jgi:hypothetical protein